MNDAKIVKLNIGASQTYIPGFINVDISKNADIVLDLNVQRLPFDDNSVDTIFSYHTLEHIQNYIFALNEIYRVLKHGGIFLVGLPYATLTEYHLVNPFHLHNFNEYSFDFFDIDKLKGSASEENTILFKKVFHRLHYIGIFHLMLPPLRSFCRRHLFNVVRKIDFGLIAIKFPGQVIPDDIVKKYNLRCEHMKYIKARRKYGNSDLTAQQPSFIKKHLRAIYDWWRGYND